MIKVDNTKDSKEIFKLQCNKYNNQFSYRFGDLLECENWLLKRKEERKLLDQTRPKKFAKGEVCTRERPSVSYPSLRSRRIAETVKG